MSANEWVTWDNLYCNIDLMEVLANGCTVVIKWPKDADGTVPEAEEHELKPILTLGTMRKNRGIDPSIIQSEIKNEKALKEFQQKPIAERVKASYTGSKAKVIGLSIYDKKPFLMATTAHCRIETRIIKRRAWDPVRRRIIQVDKVVLVIVDDYNHTMHFVDDKDRLAFYYRPNAGYWHENKFTTAHPSTSGQRRRRSIRRSASTRSVSERSLMRSLSQMERLPLMRGRRQIKPGPTMTSLFG
eukprot:3444755-Prymnesium_polylepis.1